MRTLATLTIIFAFLPLTASAQTSAPNSAAEIVEWSWRTEPDFGADGAVRVAGQVKNIGDEPIYHVEVKFTTLDGDGKVLTTEVALAQSIPVGATGSFEQRADYYGSEEKARIRVIQVYYR